MLHNKEIERICMQQKELPNGKERIAIILYEV